MIKYYYYLILLISSTYGALIVHDEVKFAKQNVSIVINAALTVPFEKVHRFSLLYRINGHAQYIETPMISIGGLLYSSEIPVEFISEKGLEYYLLLELPNFSSITFPLNSPKDNPIKIDVPIIDYTKETPVSKENINDDNFDIVGLDPEVVILSPNPGEHVQSEDVYIALSYFAMENIDYSKIQLFLDDIDISKDIYIDSTYLSIYKDDIKPGLHTIKVLITNIFGQKFNNINWNFNVIPEKIETDKIIRDQSAMIKFNYINTKANYTMGDLSYLHNINFDWLFMDLKLIKSSLENQYEQPYDRFSLHFNNDLFQIKLGDSYPIFNQYAWNGQRIRGLNLTFNREKFYLNYIKGKSRRVIQGDPNQNAIIISDVDSSSASGSWKVTLSRNNYTFQQDVSALNLGFKFKKNTWNFNYVKVQDNIETVDALVPNANIVIPKNLEYGIERNDENPNSDNIDFDYFSISDDLYMISYELFDENFIEMFGVGNKEDFLFIPTSNWIGVKPKDNYVFGSSQSFLFDNSHIELNTGFSMSFLNQNKWDSIYEISELDTLSYDSVSYPLEMIGQDELKNQDWKFLQYIDLDPTFSISDYEDYISFSQFSRPLISSLFSNTKSSINNFFSLSNICTYRILKLNYFGHQFEIGSRRNGPDFYSIMNPYLKTNYKESYFTDRFTIFENKLLFFYKRSKIIEGMYKEILKPINIKKSLFNMSFYPGENLPTFNFSYLESNRYNEIINHRTVYDTINNDIYIEETFDNRIDLDSRQISISMTNQFNFSGRQLLSLNIMRFEQIDQIVNKNDIDILLGIGYIPKFFESNSIGLNLNSIFSKKWQSRLNYNSTKINQGLENYGTSLSSQKIDNYQLNLVHVPNSYLEEIICGINYSISSGSSYFTQYQINFNMTSKPIEGLYINMLLDYRIKYLGTEEKSPNDVFFLAKIIYDIF